MSSSTRTRGLFLPGVEPGTFRVLGERDNHYTTETAQMHLYFQRVASQHREAHSHGWLTPWGFQTAESGNHKSS